MALLSDELRARLPQRCAEDSDPWIYARFILPGTSWAWYVMEGQPQGHDYLLFGFVCGQEHEFGYFLLSELEAVHSPLGTSVQQDLTFTEGRLTDVVPAPDL